MKPNVKLYPNPTRDEVNVEVEGYYDNNLSISLYDFQGILIYSQEQCSSKVSISLSELNIPNGLYVLRIYMDEVSVNEKIIYMR